MIEAMAESEEVATLRRVPLFATLPEKELKRLARSLDDRTFAAGREIAVEGREGVGFFVIESGEATVLKGGSEIRTLGPGDYFGELALIDQGPRSATVVAKSELRCRGMTAWGFRPLVEANGALAWPLLETLASRLREAEARTAQ
jgi:CRP/FNR family cyclic AMP-dependent transcriptional regulator